MHLTAFLIVAAGLLAGLPGPCATAAKPPATPAEVTGPTNAALVYTRAWLLLKPEDSDRFTEAYSSEPGWVPDGATAALLEKNQPHVAMVMRAASMPEVDWGIDYDQGFQALISHVTPLRRDARMLNADAARLALAGDPEGAAKRIAAMLRMAGQARQDGILISSLVGTAIAKSAAARATWMIDRGQMTPAAAGIVLEAARALLTDDPFGARSSIAAEGLVLLESSRRQYTGPDAGKRFAAIIAPGEQADERALGQVEAMDGAGLMAALVRVERYYRDAVSVWDQPDAAQQLGAMAGNLEKYGLMAPILAPSFTKVWKDQAAARETLGTLVRRLEQASK